MENRIALVTGASRGIGQACALALAKQGMTVIGTATSDKGAEAITVYLQAAGAKGCGMKLNVTDAAEVDAVIAAIEKDFGGIAVLVNNAGITRDNLLHKMTEADWDLVMSVHLRGSFLMTRACQTHMVAAKFGRIINLSSTSAQGNRGQTNYSTAKAGLQGMAKTLAVELGRFGITANAVAPGFIQTEMVRQTAERMGMPFEEFLAAAAAKNPSGRVGQPADIAALVTFLASDAAGFINGQVIYVAGGPRD